MKKTLLCALACLMMVPCVMAQSQKELNKERQEVLKQAEKELTSRVDKATRKEAKRLLREGWSPAPGALPMEKQLERSYLMQYQLDDNGYPLYLMSEAISVGSSYDAAKMQALELAKQNLAGQIQTEMTALIENTVANNQISPDEVASITQTVNASKNIVSQSLGRVIPIVEVYRTTKGKNKEVLVRIAYNAQMANEAAKKTIRKELENKGVELHNQLDKILGF